MSRSSWACARSTSAQPLLQRTPRSPRAARTTRGTGWRERPLSNFVKPVPRDAAAAAAQRLAICAHCETISGSRMRRWRPRRPTRWPTRRDGPSASMRGQAQWMWPCLCCMLHGCPPVVARILLGQWQVGAEAECRRCLGGGRLEQMLNAADAALGGCKCGQRQHKSIDMPLFDQDQPITQQSSRCPLAPCCSPSHKCVCTARPFESCANKSPNSPKSRSKCEIRIWSRRPLAARSKC
jgi:hypothetical protein